MFSVKQMTNEGSFSWMSWNSGPMTTAFFLEGQENFHIEGSPIGFNIETLCPNIFPCDGQVNCFLFMHLGYRGMGVSLLNDTRFDQKSVDGEIGVNRRIYEVSESGSYLAFSDFLRKRDVKAVFYNMEDAVGA